MFEDIQRSIGLGLLIGISFQLSKIISLLEKVIK